MSPPTPPRPPQSLFIYSPEGIWATPMAAITGSYASARCWGDGGGLVTARGGGHLHAHPTPPRPRPLCLPHPVFSLPIYLPATPTVLAAYRVAAFLGIATVSGVQLAAQGTRILSFYTIWRAFQSGAGALGGVAWRD